MTNLLKTCCIQLAGLMAFGALTITAGAAIPDHPEWTAALKSDGAGRH